MTQNDLAFAKRITWNDNVVLRFAKQMEQLEDLVRERGAPDLLPSVKFFIVQKGEDLQQLRGLKNRILVHPLVWNVLSGSDFVTLHDLVEKAKVKKNG